MKAFLDVGGRGTRAACTASASAYPEWAAGVQNALNKLAVMVALYWKHAREDTLRQPIC